MPQHLSDADGWLVTKIQVMTLGAVRKQIITWINVDQVLWIHMVSVGHKELMIEMVTFEMYTLGI